MIHDVLELLELQFKLIALNSREAKQSAISAAAMAVVAVGLFAVASLFTLGAIALALYEFTDLAMWSAFGIVGIASMFLAAVLGLWASSVFKHCTQAWDVSKQELGENLRWLKRSLSGKTGMSDQASHAATNGGTYQPHFERQQTM